MGEREPRDTAEAAEQKADQPQKSTPGVFNLRNIIILVVGVAIAAGLAILTVGSYIAPRMEEKKLSQQEQTSEKSDATYLEELSFFRLDPLIVNPAGSNGERYLKATIAIEMYDSEVRQELEKRLPQIKNQINNVLSSKSIDEVQTNEDKEKLRREIQNRVNGMLVTGRISNVYFEEFVYQ